MGWPLTGDLASGPIGAFYEVKSGVADTGASNAAKTPVLLNTAKAGVSAAAQLALDADKDGKLSGTIALRSLQIFCSPLFTLPNHRKCQCDEAEHECMGAAGARLAAYGITVITESVSLGANAVGRLRFMDKKQSLQ